MKSEELQVYQLSINIGEKVWNIVFFKTEINNIGVKLNNYIKSIGKTNTNH